MPTVADLTAGARLTDHGPPADKGGVTNPTAASSVVAPPPPATRPRHDGVDDRPDAPEPRPARGGPSGDPDRSPAARRPQPPRRGDREGRAPWRAVVERARAWSPRRRLVVALVGAVVVVGGVAGVGAATSAEPVERVTLNRALERIADGAVAHAEIDERAGEVTLRGAGGDEVVAAFPGEWSDELTAALLEADVDVVTVTDARASAGEEVLLRLVVAGVLVGLLVVAVRVARTGGLGGGSAVRRPLAQGEVPDVTFADVAGADEAVDQLREMVELLREPDRYAAVGATRPRGALLVGPPGTGKTLLARAVAGEAGVPFFAIAGSDFVETYVGVGARRVRDLFAEARKAERAIVFIDEIDAVGRARSADPGRSNDGERENTLIALLNEMDGFAGSSVVVLAATNRPDTLDSALTRPGRLDRQVQVPNPDRLGRTRILQVHARTRPLAPDVDLVQVARQTPGMSGADLAQVVDEACMEAARRGQDVVDADCFQAAVATVAMGRARTSALVTDFDRRVTAWHEAGHTLAATLLPDADDPVSVTIVPRGPAGGVTWMSGNDDIFLPRRKALAQLVVAMAGRAAEERLLDGEFTQGASGDIRSATALATDMVTSYGMTEFGYAQVDADTMRLGGAVAARAHEQVDRLLRDAHDQAVALLAEHAAALEALAEALLAAETLSYAQVREVLDEVAARAA